MADSGEPTWQDEWLDTPEWELARRLHNLLCRQGHQMDQCWGLSGPWELKQRKMPSNFRNWTSRAVALIERTGSVEAANAYLDGPDDKPGSHPLWGPWTVPTETPRRPR